MAGIGFELRKLLREESYTGLLRAYGYAGLISSGPWVLSILAVMALGVLSLVYVEHAFQVNQFLVSVTYLVAASLIITGPFQIMFTRFVADRLFAHERHRIMPNLIGLLSFINILSGGIGIAVVGFLFQNEPLLYRLEMLTGFVLLCNIWCVVIFVVGMKAYRQVLWAFIFGYGATLAAGLLLNDYGLQGLLGGFVMGQGLLLSILLYLVLRDYPADRFIALDIRHRNLTHRSLLFVGLFYNLGIWADKLLFWFNPYTSEPVIGPLRSSPIYDLPIFLAYLSIVPGMAVFLIRLETDFVERYDAYYSSIRNGGALNTIQEQLDAMIEAVRQGIYDILKIQGITVIALILLGPSIMDWLGFSMLYLPLFNIDLVAVGIQVLFLGILNVLFYLDRLKEALGLCFAFVLANTGLTLLSQQLGPLYYGYGYAVSLLLVTLLGFILLDRVFRQLTYETFMLQPQTIRHVE